MTVERLHQVVNATPFRPFTIHLADGKSIPVVNREFIASSPSGRTIVVFDPEDRMNILDLLLVTNLCDLPASRPDKIGRW
jgi:hypothetical protein